ncbi:hypothetical protein PYCCODRAFT_1383241 [Trametes coccinea BRFM310]|uniref:GATA-type domain-containing protein n=1 Tax=Trametes coccinea (strain BRFM310) TaxID=1353009 RepID=A0A1Y2J076_TRAC3|nr:hypothetical protein PYCCODRAFT_1383241 [Trametes coccinea BRFM310]
MSFLASQQRGYDSLSHPDLPQHQPIHPSHPSRIPVHPIQSFDNIPHQPLPQISSAVMVPNPAQPSHVSDRSSIGLPKVGETRCYWTLLTYDLTFLYLDPVLASHLGEQADLLVGRSLLDYVHPDEQTSAKNDLGAVLESKTLHGSVTRVRYCRLSRVRRLLGYTGPAPEWSDADKIAVDSNYMAVDIVINYAADNLVLCFHHAVVDLTPRDNDEHNKTCWTNWCGTPTFNMEQVQLLYHRLQSAIPQPPTMTRVFQILLNQPSRPLWLSWPQERPGEPTSKDFARLAEDVQISASGTDAKTSCTRRYKACQVMPFGMGDKREVESIFIPHGAIIFACHKINPYPRDNVVGGNGMHHLGYHSNNYATQGPQYYDPQPQNLSSSHLSSIPSYNYSPQPQPPMSSSYPPNAWVQMEAADSPGQYGQWAPSSLPNGAPVSSMRSSSYSTAPPPAPTQHHWSSQPPSYLESGSPVSPSVGPSAPSPTALQFPASGSQDHEDQPPPSPTPDLVPPPRSGRRGSKDQYTGSSRTAGNPPVGVTHCASCKATQSPEWRKGPSGKKDLCNACGLRFARSRAKKEGGSQRRRKDRAMSTLSMKPEPSPTASPVSASYPTMRRSSYFDDASFLSTSSAGSGSGNDSFSHAATFDHIGTPSPSPPSGGMQYVPGQSVNYNQPMQAERQQNYGQHAGQFYSLPPPSQGMQQPGMHHVAGNGHQSIPPSRLDPIVPFPNRLSPLVSPSTPSANSPLSASISASYERDKRHEREQQEQLMMSQQQLGPEHSYRMQQQKPPSYMDRGGPF